MNLRAFFGLAWFLLALIPARAGTAGNAIAIPGAKAPVSLDDMVYVPALHRVVVPAGQTGELLLIDPETSKVSIIDGIVSGPVTGKHFREGTTSVAYGEGYLFASSHDPAQIVIVDPRSRKIIGRVGLAGGPDYVRYLANTHQLWVTEPGATQIQILDFEAAPTPTLQPLTTIAVPGGPESLVFDPLRGRAYTNLWKDSTVVIDTSSEKVVGHWSNGCRGSRGLALDARNAHLFVACSEGKVQTLAVADGGHVLASTDASAGIDIISYSSGRSRLYVPGARAQRMTVFDVMAGGKLKPSRSVATAPHAHCVADDGEGHAFVCAPRSGAILTYNFR